MNADTCSVVLSFIEVTERTTIRRICKVFHEAYLKSLMFGGDMEQVVLCACKADYLPFIKYLVAAVPHFKRLAHLIVRNAAYTGRLNILRYAVTLKDPDITYCWNVALRGAARNKHLPEVKFLVKHGADPKDFKNQAIEFARKNKDHPMIYYLENCK